MFTFNKLIITRKKTTSDRNRISASTSIFFSGGVGFGSEAQDSLDVLYVSVLNYSEPKRLKLWGAPYGSKRSDRALPGNPLGADLLGGVIS
jgi:hypothetical protein